MSVASKTETFTAIVTDRNGDTIDTPVVDWDVSPSDNGISVNNGIVTVKSNAAAGEYTLTATASQANNSGLSADAAAATTFKVTKDNSAVTTVQVGGGQETMAVPTEAVGSASTAAFMATVYDQYGAEMSDQSVSWSLEGTPAGVSIDQNGVVTVTNKASAGEVTVKAAVGGKTGTKTLTIAKDASVATTVQVSGGQASVAVPTAAVGSASTAAFTATVYDQYGAEMTGETVTWSVPSATGVSIDDSGVVTVTNKASAGEVTVTATCNGQRATQTLTINKANPVETSMKVFYGSSEVSGTDIIGVPGSKQYTVQVYDQYGDVMDVTADLSLSTANGFSIRNNTVAVANETANDATATLTASYGSLPPVQITILAKQVSVNWDGIALKTPAQITYGDAKASAFQTLPATGTATAYVDGKETTINGTFAIQDADMVLNAGESQQIVVVFTVTSEGTYQGNQFEQSYPVKVLPKAVAVEWSDTALTYNGNIQAPTAEVTKGLVGQDTLAVTVTGAQKDAGKDIQASASIDNANYTLTNHTTTYCINPKSVTVTAGTYAVSKVYDGNVTAAAAGALGLDGVLPGDVVTVSGTLGAYADKNVGNEKTVTVTGLTLAGDSANNYTLGNETAYEVTNAAITPKTVTVVSGITAQDKVYDANTSAALVGTDAVLDGKVENDTLSVTATGVFVDKNVNAAKVVTIRELTLTGTDAGNYTLAADGNQTTATAAITPFTLSVGNGSVTVSKIYDGKTDAGALSGTLDLTGMLGADAVTVDMTKVTVGAYSDSKVGTYTVDLTLGDGFLTGADAGNYTVVSPYPFDGAKITKQNQAALTITGMADKTYGDAPFVIEVSGGSGEGAYTLTSSDLSILKLTPGKENGQWTAEILKAGEVTLTAGRAGDDNYEPAAEKTGFVTISPKTIAASDFTFDLANKTYTGTEIQPAVTSDLAAGTDYTVAYSDNVNVGQAAITVTGQGNYTGTVTENFQIEPKTISGVTISGVAESYPYTGSAITPDVTVTDGTMTLVKDKDYTVEYSNNTSVGTATITITGVGNYKETATTTFAVAAAPASGTVIISGTATGQGGAYQPGDTLTASVTNGGVDQPSYQWYNKDAAIEGATNDTYTLKVGDTNVYVEVTSSGNYVGTLKSETIEVGKIPLPGTVTASVEDKDGNGKNGIDDIITVTVSDGPSAEHYDIVWMRDDSVISGESGTTYTIAKADQGKTICVKIVAKGDVYTGEKTAAEEFEVAAVKPDAPALSARAESQKVTLTWAAPYDGGSAITGYTLTVKPENGETTEYTLAANETSYEVTDLTNGTTYTFTLTATNGIGTSEAGTATATPTAPSSSGGGGSSTSTTTEKNPDGSTTTTVTDKTTGTVTETTKNTDGSTTVVETKKDGTVTETNKTADGTTGTVVTDKNGDVTEVKASVSSAAVTEAAKSGEAVTLPVEVPAAKSTEDAPAVEISLSKSAGSVKVEIPVEKVTPGTVAILVKADGTEKIVKTSVVSEDGVILALAGSSAVKLVDNSKDFNDTRNHWAKDAIDFVTAREIFNGTSDITFTPNARMTRGMLMTVLARLDGQDTTGGTVWYEKGMEWAKKNGVSDGTNPNQSVTREQLATMLYRYAGSPAANGSFNGFPDGEQVNDYANAAMRWAVGTGLVNGMGDGTLNPQGDAARAQLATILMRFIEKTA